MLKSICTALVLTLTVGVLHAEGRVLEIRRKTETNPTIYCNAAAGNDELAVALKRFLGVCGWFDLAPTAENADYTVNIVKGNNDVTIQLNAKKQPLGAWRFRAAAARELAKSITDTLIEKVFAQLKVRGFCHSRIAFGAETAHGVRNIYVCDIDGGEVEQITRYKTMNVEPCWSPNGRSLFFSKYNAGGIDIVETTIATPRRSRIVSAFRGINTGAAVSPDGKSLAVILSPDHVVDLYVLGLGRKSKLRLTRGIPVEASPCWSPDGSEIAFVSDQSGSPRIYIISATGGASRKIPTIGAEAVTPAWNRDGKIAYATRIGGEYALAVYDLKSGENRRITKEGGSWESPEWAADNRQVVCKRTSGGKSALFVVDTLTGKSRQLLHTGNALFDPAWSPCRPR